LKSFQIFRTKVTNRKPLTVDDFFKTYPVIPFSHRSNSGRTVPLIITVMPQKDVSAVLHVIIMYFVSSVFLFKKFNGLY
jgi:hypothetical protein